MFDAAEVQTGMQRVRGHASVALSAAPGGARLTGLRQQGSAKAFLPRVHGCCPEVVFLNTAGGLTGGDRLSYGVTLDEGARIVATTQTAERAYAASSGVAEVEVGFDLAPGARLDWLPQETILFEGSALSRRSRFRLAGDAACLLAEMVVLGRAAMGEVLSRARLHDRREVTRDGRPVLIEPLRLGAAALGQAGNPAGLAGARALATVALVAPGAEDALGPLRAALGGEGVVSAASAWDGRCVARFAAADALPLKQAVARALTALRGGAALPRVWQI
jgi:urease accessory protein